MKQNLIVKKGQIIKTERNEIFKVKLENDNIITCTISGKMRLNKIHLIEGDFVTVELSPYDMTRGRISWKG